MNDAKKVAKDLRNEAAVLIAKANKLIDAAKILEDLWNGSGNGKAIKTETNNQSE